MGFFCKIFPIMNVFNEKLVCCGCYAEREEQGPNPLKRCSRCLSVWYCSVECQKKAWAVHKTVCNTGLLDGERLKRVSGINSIFDKERQYKAPMIPGDEAVVCQFKEADGAVRAMTQREFQEKMRVKYAAHILASQVLLLRMFDEKAPKAEEVVFADDAIAIEKQGDMGYGVVAVKDIPKGALLCPFSGMAYFCSDEDIHRIIEGSFEANAVMIHDKVVYLSQMRYASTGAVFNDGPANCKIDLIINKVQGEVSKEAVVKSLRDIKAGEALYINYGPKHPQKRAPYTLTREAYQKAVVISREDRGEPFLSICQTPRILAELFLRGDLPARSDAIENYPAKMALSLIKESERVNYIAALDQMSQYGFVLVCEYMDKVKSVPSAAEFIAMGKLMDHLILLMRGTLNGDLWLTDFHHFYSTQWDKERVDKIRAIEKKQIPEKLDDGTVIPPLPATFIDYFSKVPERFWDTIEPLRQTYLYKKMLNSLGKK